MKDPQYKVILEEIRKVASRVDTLEKAVNNFKDVPPSDAKKINDTLIALGTLTDQVKAMRDEIDNLGKKTTDTVEDSVASSVKKEIAPVVKTMNQFEKNKTLVVKEVHHKWLTFWPFQKRGEK